jgi:hypothetical protein
MKFTSSLKLLTVVLVVAAGALMVGATARSNRIPTKTVVDGTAADPVLAKIADYKKWTRVNPTPELMDRAAAAACAAVVPAVDRGPHRNKYVTVFVNAEGSPAMLEQVNPHFPVGSIVVKEKLNSPTEGTPELLTAMVKREAGFNPASGDWEYLVLDGNASTITQRGKLASCNSCHTAYKDQDYITRSYLPAKTQLGLK